MLYLLPFGFLPFYPAAMIWIVATFGLVALVLIAITKAPRETFILALGFPAMMLNLSQGQNAFLTTALLAGGLYLLPTRPVLAGILFGLLTYKPQFGLILPLALLVSMQWRCIAAACVTTLLAAALSSVAFGPEAWASFIAQIPQAGETLRLGLVDWKKMISAYAMVRVAEFDHGLAMAIQGVVAAVAAMCVVWTWLPGNRVCLALRNAALLVATLIATPFALNYDLYLLAPALAWFGVHAINQGWLTYEKITLGLVYLTPLLWLLFAAVFPIPFPLLALFMIIIMRRSTAERDHGTQRLKAA